MKRLYILTISIVSSFILFASSNAQAQTITVTDVPTTLCANESFSLSYSATGGYITGNQFIAQLSDQFGSFAAPVNIGSITTTLLNDFIYVTIPSNTALSPTSAYRIRIVSSNPVVTGIDNGTNIIINCLTRDYSWIGGAGNWSDLNHWEWTTDGINYTPASEMPLATDNVNFDAQSFPAGGQLTLDVYAYCNDFYWEPGSGVNNPVIWGNWSGRLYVYGDFELDAGVYRDIYYLYLESSKQNISLNFGDNLFQKDPNTTYWKGGNIYINNSGSADLASNFVAESIRINKASFTLYTNSFNVEAFSTLYSATGSVIEADNSIFKTYNLQLYGTFNAGTSSIYLYKNKYGYDPVIYTTNTYASVFIESGICNISSSNTFDNLSLINGTGVSLGAGSTQTVNLSLTALGTDRGNLATINSTVAGSTATIALGAGASVNVNYTQIKDNIISDGFGGVFTASNSFDGGNNQYWNIQPLTPLDYYWVGGAGDWTDLTHWNTSPDGGSTFVPATAGPGPVDDIFFTANSFPSGGTLNVDKPVTLNNMTWEPGSGGSNPSISGNNLTITGNLKMANGVRRAIDLTFYTNSGIINIDLADNYLSYGNLTFTGGGTFNLLSDFTGSSLYFYDGTFNSNNNIITVTGVFVYSDLSVLNWGSSDVYISSSLYNYATTPTFDATNATFYFDNAYYLKGPFTFNTVNIVSGNLSISGNNTFNTLTADAGSTLTFAAGQTQTIVNTLNLQGSRSLYTNIKSNSTITNATLLVTGATVIANYLELTNITIDNGLAADVLATNSIDNLGNIGWNIVAPTPLNYYWIGGTGNWTDTRHWADITGDSTTRPEPPGFLDNIFFTTSSFPAGGTVTLDQAVICNDMTWEAGSGSSFPIIQGGYSNDLTIRGSLQMANGVSRNLYRLNFESDATGNTITMADNLQKQAYYISFSGNGEWTLLDSLATQSLSLKGGTLNTNNQPISSAYSFRLDYSSTSTVNMGASNVYLRVLECNSAGVTFDAGSSTFIFSDQYNVSLRGNYPVALNNVIIDGNGIISNSFTMNSLEILPGSDITVSAGQTQTINNSFIANGSRSRMVNIHSTAPTNFVVNTTGTATLNVDYTILKNIALDNGSGFTTLEIASRSVDEGGNTGWDFLTTPLVGLNYYWVGGTGNWSDANHWATTDGGSTLHTSPPGFADNLLFTNSSFPGGGTITLDQPSRCNNMTWTDGSLKPTITGDYTNRLTVHGSLSIAPGVNRNLTYIVFDSKTTNQILLGDNQFKESNFEFKGGGTWNLIDSLATDYLGFYGGTLNTNNQPVTITEYFSLSGNEPISFDFSASTFRVGYLSNYATNVTNAIVGTSTFIIEDGGSIGGYEVGFYNLTIPNEATINNKVTVDNNLTILPGGSLYLDPFNELTVGNLVANGTRPSPVTIASTSEGMQATIRQTSGVVNASHIVLKDNNAVGTTFNATDAYDKGNVTGWNITPITPINYYWMAGSDNWSNRLAWSLTDGSNNVPATAPGPADNVFFTTSGSLVNGGIVNLDIPAQCNTMTWSAGLNGPSIAGEYTNPLTVHGSLILAPTVKNNIEHIIFNSDLPGNSINMADNLSDKFVTMDFKGAGDWTLMDSLAVGRINYGGGALFTAGFPLMVDSLFYMDYFDSINLDNSDVYLHYLPYLWSGEFKTQTSNIYFDDGAEIIGSYTFNNVDVDGEVTFRSGNNSFNTLTLNPGSTLYLPGYNTQTVTQLNAIGLRSRPISILSTDEGMQATILQGSGVVNGKYLILQDNKAAGNAAFSATSSIDDGNVTGWNISPISSRTYYWVGGSGLWSEFSTHWAIADGGTTFYDASPGALDDVFFTANSFTSGDVLELDFPVSVRNMDWTGNTATVSIDDQGNTNNTLTIGESLIFSNGVTRDFEELIFDSDTPGNTIFLADNLFTYNIIEFYGTGDWTLTGPLAASGTDFHGGTFNSGNMAFDSPDIYMDNSSISYWGSSVVTTQDFANYLDIPENFNSESSTFNFNGQDYNNIIGSSRFYITKFNGDIEIDSANVFYNATVNQGVFQPNNSQAYNSLTMAAGTTLSIKEGTTQTVSAALDLNGTAANPVYVNCVTDGKTGIISMPVNSTVTATYVHLIDNTATGGATFNTTFSSDFGNVNGWLGLLIGQEIDFPPLSDQPLTSGTFNVSATATSALSPTFEIASGSATIINNTVTPSASGLIGVRALQAGDNTYGAALSVIRYIHIDATNDLNELGNMKEARVVLGQPDGTTDDYIFTSTSLPDPFQVAVNKQGGMTVAMKSRILHWSSIPLTSSIAADSVLGQADFTSSDSQTASASTFLGAATSLAYTSSGGLFVADSSRVLYWTKSPFINNQPANFVIGQSDFFTSVDGTGSAQLSLGFHAVAYYNDIATGTEKVLISDQNNNRILVYNALPTGSGMAASVVIGQADFTSNTPGDGAAQLDYPAYISVTNDGKLLVADAGNNRILVYNSIPTTNGASADFVLGQSGFNLSDPGLGPNAYNMPTSVSVSRTGLVAITDYQNSRVIIYDSLPNDNVTAPKYILGQPDANTAIPNYVSISGRSMSEPISASWDISNNLYITDLDNSRVMLYGGVDSAPPPAFTTGVVTVIGNTGNNYWNYASTAVEVTVPIANDQSLNGGSIQLQTKIGAGVFTNIGSLVNILAANLGAEQIITIDSATLKAAADYNQNDTIVFRAIIADVVNNQTIGTESSSKIIIDTVSPAAFTTGAIATLATDPMYIVPGYWNANNTGVEVTIPIANDISLAGGTVQLKMYIDGGAAIDVGAAATILSANLGGNLVISLSKADFEAITGLDEGSVITANASITDVAGNPETVGALSATTIIVDRIAPAVDTANSTIVSTYVDGEGTQSQLVMTEGIKEAILHFNLISTDLPGEFRTTVLALDANNTHYVINYADLLGITSEKHGIVHYLELTDNAGNRYVENSRQLVNIKYPLGVTVINFGVGKTSEDYKMMAIPLNLEQKSVNDVFEEIYGGTFDKSKMRIFSYAGGNATTYNELSGSSPLNMGVGYFALAASGASVTTPAGATSFESVLDAASKEVMAYSIDLVAGWNMIGNPFMHAVDWADIETLSNITAGDLDAPQIYNGATYPAVTAIPSNSGAFIHNNTAGTISIKIPVRKNTGGRISGRVPNRNPLFEDSWEVLFNAKENNGSEFTIGGIGMEPEAIFSKDQFDMLNPPAFARMKILNFDHPEFSTHSFKLDIRETTAEEKWEFDYKVENEDNSEHTITWDNSYFGDGAPDIILVDKTHFTTVNMKQRNTYTFKHAGITQFEVYYGDNALQSFLPEQIVVPTPFPNPFNQQVNINIGLPKSDSEYKVIVTVYNTMGMQVATLTNGTITSGYHTFTWTGTNNEHNIVPKGIYTYRVIVEGEMNEVITGKIVKY